MSRKGAKSQTGSRTLRSTGTKEGKRVGRIREPRADFEQQLAACRRELVEAREQLAEALEQQTGTSEVLRVISSSPGELEPVFQSMLEKAVRICGAKFGTLMLRERDVFRIVALHGASPEYAEYRQRQPFLPAHRGTALARVAASKRLVQIADIQAEAAYTGNPSTAALVNLIGARTLLTVPMLKANELIGAISIYRQEVRPFTDKQIELVQNFATQAVIAIENTRLLNELRQRTDDLSEALEQQTATSEVLRVISSSPGELEPVFETVLANAVQICGAKFGVTSLREGGVFRVIATHGAPSAFVEQRRQEPLIRPTPGHNLERMMRTNDVVHVPDILADPNSAPTLAKFGGAKALVNVPLRKDGDLIGSIVIFRQEAGPFTDKQIELVKNFAAQAVIAIENTRLLNELRELLAQQTATADVLKVISRSTFDLQGVLNTLVDSAALLCRADIAVIRLAKNGAYHHLASRGFTPEQKDYMKRHPWKPDRGSIGGRAVLEGKAVQTADAKADREFTLVAGDAFQKLRTNSWGAAGPRRTFHRRAHLGAKCRRTIH